MPFTREALTNQDREYLSWFPLKSQYRCLALNERFDAILDRGIPAYWIGIQRGLGNDPEWQDHQFSVFVFEDKEFPVHSVRTISKDGRRLRFEV